MAPLRIAIVAGEASGDELGASLLKALAERGIPVEARGVGGPVLKAAGLESLFDQADIAVMGLGPVIRRLPLLMRRIRETAESIIAWKPDLVLTIDSPDFCKRVARRVRAGAPAIPIVHWVCPSVWAWRPGRAPAMKPYIDDILCLLPFEPAALARLGGPVGHYVGHPLIERLGEYRPRDETEAAVRADAGRALALLLPGSRHAELHHLLPVFLETVRDSLRQRPGLRWVLPTLKRLEPEVRRRIEAANLPIEVIADDVAKRAAFREARVALAASGTVTLELALAGIPTVAAYRVAAWEAFIARRLIKVPSVILPNLILDERAVPEFLQEEAMAARLAPAVLALVDETPARAAQIEAFARLEQRMRDDGAGPSEKAARLVLDVMAKRRKT
ncbi:lipid-A-disaccharide synthase [Rhabdaerophilum sp. SD176]|uniref:lipid-A-disaccharide synthase n=1 Tax=Rhabdaerophilum sp. SD176 TaxID=2983548 RepID=UPI0024DF766D|nr:lipid-A-disaccharide synthase [Rhabdaerophilum sp. SD176]